MSETATEKTRIINSSERPQAQPTTDQGPAENSVAGYTLVQRLGSGGYGEVWKAVGPGGFHKAVKILSGQFNGPKAETELRALERIRELRHPFLLNIERVQVSDDRLIVVSELADCSLFDRCSQCLSEGLPGIPRAELLGYLGDAAEALDFMSERYELQHLDIKPENILLQGGRGKVADFGLAQHMGSDHRFDIRGFTPRFVAPELLQGQQSLACDQYSLAIVFLVMLTGKFPFSGRTPAQLAAQHLKSAPDLSALRTSDRAVVSRALSKKPEQRFRDCREFISELRQRSQRNPAPGADRRTTDRRKSDKRDFGCNAGRSESMVFRARPSEAARAISPSAALAKSGTLRPAIVIGVGGTGAGVVQQFRNLLATEFDGASLPSISCICIDTDRQALSELRRETLAQPLPDLHTLAVPLKSAQEYRRTASDHLNWLNRRWLFNIPRSGNVDGMRPLGRLAIVDHRPRAAEFLGQHLRLVLDRTAAAATSQQTGLEVTCETPDIYLVGSTSGGSGSGMLLDIATLIRSLLNDCGHDSGRLYGVLLHATGGTGTMFDLQCGNTIAFLKEPQHYNRQASNNHQERPIDQMWLLPQESGVSDDSPHSMHAIAVFLQNRILSSASPSVRYWEEQNSPETTDGMRASTMGLQAVPIGDWQMNSTNAAAVGFRLIRTVLQCDPIEQPDVPEELVRLLQHTVETTQMIPGKSLALVTSIVRQDAEPRIRAYAEHLANELLEAGSGRVAPETVFTTINELLARHARNESTRTSSLSGVLQHVRQALQKHGTDSLQRMDAAVRLALDSPSRLAAAKWIVHQLRTAAAQTASGCRQQLPGLRATTDSFCDTYTQERSGTTATNVADLAKTCDVYLAMLVCQTA
ncbi:MAG: serine/threonine protein kinase, partial [Planctomycetaceae bacterium]|nr:serine/threonine protein kinase [Planctomycetaceae bacterium]